MPGRKTLFLAGLLALVAGLFAFRGADWFLLKKSLRHRFPKVDWISTDELAQWMADSSRPGPLLLDVRTTKEWDVSHLAGARRVEPNADVKAALERIGKETPIVTYCAIGYRSGELATRLRAAGYTHVRNLEGSIFAWANEGRPLVQGRQPVKIVHPYNSFWGRLLREDVRAPLGR
ncbi:MAG TPA: rhodanese-like domain-containing protein [Chthoniobacterales bacterium]|nr:rhodanese-like domain-containing protein [Chthoniobacterales bacterium]